MHLANTVSMPSVFPTYDRANTGWGHFHSSSWYAVLGQRRRQQETKFAISSGRKVDFRSAAQRAFAYIIFPKITTYMTTFLGHPVSPICRLVVSFYGAIWKTESLKHVQQTKNFWRKECRITCHDNVTWSVMNRVPQYSSIDGRYLRGVFFLWVIPLQCCWIKTNICLSIHITLNKF